MISKKKVWIRLYTGIFLLVMSFVLHSAFVHVHSYSTRTQNYTKASNFAKNVSSIELLISSIASVGAMEPPEEVLDQCHPPDLSPRENINCRQHPGLSGDYIARIHEHWTKTIFTDKNKLFLRINILFCRTFASKNSKNCFTLNIWIWSGHSGDSFERADWLGDQSISGWINQNS